MFGVFLPLIRLVLERWTLQGHGVRSAPQPTRDGLVYSWRTRTPKLPVKAVGLAAKERVPLDKYWGLYVITY